MQARREHHGTAKEQKSGILGRFDTNLTENEVGVIPGFIRPTNVPFFKPSLVG